MAWTAPRTWVALETVTAALFNTHLRDNLLDLDTRVPALPADTTKFLRGDGAWQVPPSGGGPTVYRKTTSKAVNTTVAATDLLNAEITIGAGVMSTGGRLRMTVWGDYLNNAALTLTPPRFQVVFGGTTLLDTGVAALGSNDSATRQSWGAELQMMNLGAANSQASSIRGWIVDTGDRQAGSPVAVAFTTGSGSLAQVAEAGAAGGITTFDGATTSAVDTSGAKALVLNVINPSASASYETRLLGAFIDVQT